jgi:ketosteroid isomerase-like protein
MARAVCAVGVLVCALSGVARPATAADERATIEQVIRDNIGWALTKDRPLLERTLAHDERLFIVNPEGPSTAGWAEFVKGFGFWLDPRFKATRFELRELRIDLARSGEVAWWSCVLDDLAEWDGRPVGWKDTRWTGVLEKRAGAWVIVQMHFSFDARKGFPRLQGPYLGQPLPGRTPALFAPGIVSAGNLERDVALSPDGRELYFGVAVGQLMTILWTRWRAEGWTEPEVAPFAADPRYLHFEPCLSADGQRMYFLTNRPGQGEQEKPGWAYQHIWAVDRQPDGAWGEPYDPGPVLNGGGQQFYPSLTRGGTLYFTRVDAATGKPAIFRSRPVQGKLSAPERLPDAVNGQGTPYNASIAPDESYLIAPVDGRPVAGNPGLANYFVFFRDKADRWSEGVPLGPEINLPGSRATSASVSPDGKVLFFAAQRTDARFGGARRGWRLSDLQRLAQSSQNGDHDIYWVDARILEDLRPKPAP